MCIFLCSWEELRDCTAAWWVSFTRRRYQRSGRERRVNGALLSALLIVGQRSVFPDRVWTRSFALAGVNRPATSGTPPPLSHPALMTATLCRPKHDVLNASKDSEFNYKLQKGMFLLLWSLVKYDTTEQIFYKRESVHTYRGEDNRSFK